MRLLSLRRPALDGSVCFASLIGASSSDKAGEKPALERNEIDTDQRGFSRSLASNRSFTIGLTNWPMSPPNVPISRTSVAEMNR